MITIQERLLSLGPNRPGEKIAVRRIIIHRTGDRGQRPIKYGLTLKV